jgi:hypothetical protein
MNALANEIIAASQYGKVMDGSLDDPRWAQAINAVHDWRNHVPDVIRAVWDQLNEVARASVFYMASEAANAEEWD